MPSYWPAKIFEAMRHAEEIVGDQRQTRSRVAYSSRTAAILESGHAVVAHRLGGQIRIIEIGERQTERGNSHGRTRITWGKSTPVGKMIMVLLAGPIAHLRIDTSDSVVCLRDDHMDLHRLVDDVCKGDVVRRATIESEIPLLIEATAEIIDADWPLIEKVADALLAHGKLTGSRFVKAMR